MPTDASIATIIVVVALITFASRIVGPFMMIRIGASPRVTRFLDGLSVSVVAALVASMLAQGTLRDGAAVAVAAVVMLATRSATSAMLAGILCAAAWSFIA